MKPECRRALSGEIRANDWGWCPSRVLPWAKSGLVASRLPIKVDEKRLRKAEDIVKSKYIYERTIEEDGDAAK